MQEVYISVDVETLGGNPQTNPMFNIGAAAYSTGKKLLGTFNVNLSWADYAVADKDTLEWFKTKHAEAYASMQTNQQSPSDAMQSFQDWCLKMAGGHKIVFLAYPTVFDGAWLYSYWHRFLGGPPGRGLWFRFIDIRSYAMGKLNLSTYSAASMDRALKPFVPPADAFPHTHRGDDDAVQQALLFFNVRDGITVNAP